MEERNGIFRAHANASPQPSYLEWCKKQRHQGRVVADLIVSRTGKAERVNLLEATGDDMGMAVAETLRRWRFAPFKLGGVGAARVVGRLVFYFRVRGEAAEVIDAAANLALDHNDKN